MDIKRLELYSMDSPTGYEAYKVLRTNIQFNTPGNRIKTIAVIDFAPKSGKTSVAINLAVSFARNCRKVLLVDADLRKPAYMKRLGGDASIGLTGYICSEYIMLRDIIFETNIHNLSFIPAGKNTSDSAELVNSSRFSELMREVRERYDIILVDTPCLGNVIDGAVIASKTDGSIIVIAPGSVNRHKAKALKQQLEQADSAILGVVLNKAADYYDKGNSCFNASLYFDTAKDVKKYALKRFGRGSRSRRREYD